jgi:hypothetical protein
MVINALHSVGLPLAKELRVVVISINIITHKCYRLGYSGWNRTRMRPIPFSKGNISRHSQIGFPHEMVV